ncbi:putative alkaline shock family protein YloU [Weissella uvarum]|uniref:Asp23/Gls24 family envelope stress response protein n=1 Tax=Weissella uvarum TaxID=1479233 RepID=UPI0019611E24|nr:Asp23/Gls24 family envelope stress response protein [Weissella uvarum]MBM7617978.1 putative alkaline shock family protein YloU [Weissella uvarum]MCM0596197.1 Asp23/Gls24 family envelope stress response protein [Weissella uvarum]
MAEETILLDQPADTQGATRVNVRVLDIIAALATQEVEGVASLRGSLSDRAQEVFGRQVRGKGVELVQSENGLIIDVYVYLNYGVNVPKLAAEIQERVTLQIAAMTELAVSEVNVHVEGMISPKFASQFDPNNLFGEKDVAEDA